MLSCTDEATVALITVKNNTGTVQPDVLVYEFEYAPYHEYGSNPNYANTQKLTDKQGVAQFDLQGYEFEEGKQEATLYFTVFTSNINSTDVIGTVLVLCKKGETVSAEIIVNE